MKKAARQAEKKGSLFIVENRACRLAMATKTEWIAAPPSIRDCGAAVVLREAAALHALADSLGTAFEGAVECLVGTARQVVVTGLGKSGHVARKMASTLAATGTPACFVHAGEAGHGDLGMIVPGDVVVALSNSGETAEMRPIIHRAKQIGVPVIAIASRAQSFLLTMVDFGLRLPEVDEACPHGTAPTSSTAMMMALGDALAVSVMRVRETTLDDIARLHPAGSIGNRLAPVETLLRPRARLPAVGPGASLRDAILEMTSHGRGVVCVLDEHGLLMGVITDGDVRRSIDAVHGVRCEDIMTRQPVTVRANTTREDAYHIMHDSRVNVLIVVDRENPLRPLGVIHIHDLELIA